MTEVWHHILAHPDAEIAPRTLARAIAPHVHRTAIDETQRLRYSGGWIWRDEPDERIADHVARECAALSIDHIRLTTDAPIPLTPIEPVVRLDLEEDVLIAEVPGEVVEFSFRDVTALAVGVTGTRRGALDAKERGVHRQVEGMLMGLSFTEVRAALLETGLARPQPQAYLALAGRAPLLRLERATQFPTLTRESGSAIGLDGWLAFVDRALEALPARRILPGVREFWNGGAIDPLLWDPAEHREPRLAWLRHWLDRHGDLESSPGAGDRDPGSDP